MFAVSNNEPDPQPEDLEVCSGDWWNCVSKGNIAAALVISVLLLLFAFMLGQDNPKPGTVITEEVMTKLNEAEDTLRQKQELEKEVAGLRESISYLEDKLAKDSGEDVSPIQTFISGPDYSPDYTTTYLSPFGLNILVESRWLELPRVFEQEDEFQERALDAKVRIDGQEPFKLPTDHSWVRLNNLVMVRLCPNEETKFLGFAYPEGINGHVLTYTYRALETSISPTISTF